MFTNFMILAFNLHLHFQTRDMQHHPYVLSENALLHQRSGKKKERENTTAVWIESDPLPPHLKFISRTEARALMHTRVHKHAQQIRHPAHPSTLRELILGFQGF